MIRTFTIMMIWHKAKDPSITQMKVEVFYGIWIFLMEAGWIIYGNTFIYDDEYKNCELGSRFKLFTAQIERNTVLVLIIYGYFLLAGIIFTLIFFCVFYFGYKSYIQKDLEIVGEIEDNNDAFARRQTLSKTQRFVGRLIDNDETPMLLKSMQTYRQRRFTRKETNANKNKLIDTGESNNLFTDKVESGLCYQAFKPEDDVVFC